jgi:lipoyl(octanoyl) transferase
MNSSNKIQPDLQNVQFRDLGLIDYKDAWDLQENLFTEVINRKLQNRNLPAENKEPTRHYLLFCEHPHVYTLGRSGDEANLIVPEKELYKLQATFYKNNRGGDITYHGPGQLVGYPIFDLDHFFTDIHKYMRFLEEAVIRTLKEYGVDAGRIPGCTGVWIDEHIAGKARKICAFGVRCSRWVTMHGFAFNVNTELSYFNNIIPCGIRDKSVTSLKQELGKEIIMEEVKNKLKFHLSEIFGMKLID